MKLTQKRLALGYGYMTPERVKETGRQFGQKIGTKEAKRIAAVLAPRPWERK